MRQPPRTPPEPARATPSSADRVSRVAAGLGAPRRDRRRDARRTRSIVVCGETGSGKTTQLPKIALTMGRGRAHGGGLIGHTQPRRIAASSVARRIAEELKTPLGEVVGYKVRFQDRLSAGASVKLMTDGILLAETQSDPLLRAYDTIIVDEAHERSLNIDFLLGHLRQILPRRPDLKIIVTSATIDAERFANHFASKRRAGAGAAGLGPALSGRDPLAAVRGKPRPRSRRRDLRRRRRALARHAERRRRRRRRRLRRRARLPPRRARDPRRRREAAEAPSARRRGAAALLPPQPGAAGRGVRAAQRAPDRARHQRRRDLAHRARHPLRHRRRHGADQALQLSQQGRAAADRAGEPGGGEPARRPLRPGRRRHLHPPLRRGRLRRPAALHRAGDRALVAGRRDPADEVAEPRRGRGLPVPRGAAEARHRRRLPAAERARRDRRRQRADADRPRAGASCRSIRASAG